MSSHLSAEALETGKNLAELQDLVESISEANFSEVLTKISESKYFSSKVDSIAHIIYFASRVRPFVIDLLVRLAVELSKKSKEFEKSFLEELFSRQHQNIGRYFLLFKCYQNKIVPYEKIADTFKYLTDRNFMTEAMNLLFWFAPEIEENHPNLFQLVKKPEGEDYDEIDPEYRSFWDHYQELKNDNWALLKEKRDIGLNDNEFIQIFAKDDVEKLKAMEFDVNSTIPPYCYDRCPILGCNPTLLCCAAYMNAVKCCRYLIEKGADRSKADDRMRSPSIMAVAGGSDPEILQMLGDDVYSNLRAILVAASNHRNSIIEKKFTSESQDLCGGILHQAAGTNNIKAALLCFDKGIDVNMKNQNGETPLHYAALYGHSDIVDLILSCEDVDVNSLTESHQPPLHLAMSSFSPKTAEIILSHPKIDPLIKGETGQTALHLAAIYEYTDIFKKLLQMPNIDINAVNQNKRSPLYLALMNSSFTIANILLDMPNININQQDAMDRAVLHLAVLLRNSSILQKVISIPGIDFSLKEMHEMTALDYAVRIQNNEAIQILTPLTPKEEKPEEKAEEKPEEKKEEKPEEKKEEKPEEKKEEKPEEKKEEKPEEKAEE
ncbi:hypothetical protein TRFO_15418 [Tritrichomonas foetus]|uniref:Uncharacterized protein n=1 Tax=Tritrichomonas foetus TaxID=1144522 RepID=A0A1J4KX28_9EUKA|nr:hypothetical protein TRFO_15418 [Tritrichomonas foetus]|eukprot:OHT14260.1 hypothetical protein TRFO_15418 [Tritrichomonas foetus]